MASNSDAWKRYRKVERRSQTGPAFNCNHVREIKTSEDCPGSSPRLSRTMELYHTRGVAERQTRGAQDAEGIARAGSNPAAPTIRRQTASGRFSCFKE